MKRKSLTAFIIITGLLIVGLAVFAQRLGIDHNPGWGRGRIVLLIMGLCTLVAGIFLFLSEKYAIPNWILKNQDAVFAAKLWQKYAFILPVVVLVVIVYIWFISAGLWITWPPRTEYYSLLAHAFQEHELHLPVVPSEKLLALSNPYDPSQRQGVGEPLDFSLYKGKFYLYWGPVPALILAAFQSVLPRDLPDLYLVFGFSCGLFLLQMLLIVVVWDRYYSGLPKWILMMSAMLVGLSGPLVWMICTGEIYEAAIVGGQFFLVAGFLTALSAVKEPSSNIKLVLTGGLWALALGTRLTLLLPIGFMMAMVVYMLWRNHSARFGLLAQKIIYFGSPVLFGLILLAWYNWARFGSVSETGFTYVLAGTNIQNTGDELLSYRYILQNFYNYFLAPFRLEGQFPFIYSNDGSIKSLLPFYHLPEFYNTNPITGLVYVLPFVFFSLCHLSARKRTDDIRAANDNKKPELVWIVNTLAGAALIALLFLFMFFWAAMRYVLDFSIMLLMVSIIGYFRGYTLAKERGFERYMMILGVFGASLSIGMSTILAISGNIVLFQQVNPAILTWFEMLTQ